MNVRAFGVSQEASDGRVDDLSRRGRRSDEGGDTRLCTIDRDVEQEGEKDEGGEREEDRPAIRPFLFRTSWHPFRQRWRAHGSLS